VRNARPPPPLAIKADGRKPSRARNPTARHGTRPRSFLTGTVPLSSTASFNQRSKEAKKYKTYVSQDLIIEICNSALNYMHNPILHMGKTRKT
jgi:hypothetical protein